MRKTKALAFGFLLILSLLIVTPFAYSYTGSDQMYQVQSGMDISQAYQWKSFYDQGLFWVFYAAEAEAGLKYKTSDDLGQTWSSENNITSNCKFGTDFSLWYDETNDDLYYVSVDGWGGPLYYRKGEPQIDGSITWDFAEVTVDANAYWMNPSIALNSSGMPWITAFYSEASTYYQQVVRPNDTEGETWLAREEVFITYASNTQGWLLPLSFGQMYLLVGQCHGDVWDYSYGKLWNGSGWESTETPVPLGWLYGSGGRKSWSAVNTNDNWIHFVFRNTTNGYLMYAQRDYILGTWSSPVVLESTNIKDAGQPTISCQFKANDLYVFYGNNTGLYVKSKVYGAWNDPEKLFGDETGTGYLSTFNRVYGGRIGVLKADEFGYINAWRTSMEGNLDVQSLPLGITFDITEIGSGYTTPQSFNVVNQTYHIIFPDTHETEEANWTFSHWEDGSTNTTRTLDFTENCTITAYYTTGYEPLEYPGVNPVFECAMNNMFELNGILEGNDTYRQMLLDSSPYENHGKIYPLDHPYVGPSITWGKMGKALEFDGIDDSVIVANSDSLNVTDAITIEFWFNVYNATPNQVFISKYESAIGQWLMGIEDSQLYTSLWTSSGNEYTKTLTSENITEGVFYFFGLTYDFRNAYYTIHLHGEPQLNVTTDGNKIRNVDKDLYLGNLGGSSLWFEGVLDEIRIFPYVRNYPEIYTDARTPISKFDTWTFVNSGTSNNGEEWTVIEGTSDGYQGFTQNDPELPWAYANNTHPFTFVRTIKYVAGFQSYQLYCTVKYTTNNMYYGGNYIIWYWSFFKDGRLQVTYDIIVKPSSIDGSYHTPSWEIKFRRVTPYFETQELLIHEIDVNTTLFPESIPIIVTAWVGPDNKHFSVRFDTQDERVVTSSNKPPFMYSFDLIDADLNVHITDWFDGWIVAGLKVNAHRTTSTKWARMEIESHKLNIINAIRNFYTTHIGPIVSYLLGKVRGPLDAVSKQVDLLLQAISEHVGTVVKKIGEGIVDALSGLSHDIIGGLSGLGTIFRQALQPLYDMFGGIGSAIASALSGYARPILSAVASASEVLRDAFIGLIDGMFGAFGFPGAFSNFLDFITDLWTFTVNSFTWVINGFTPIFAFFAVTMTKFFNTLGTVMSSWVQIVQGIWNMLDTGMGYGKGIWEMLNLAVWVQIFAIMYPIYLLFLWEEKGLDAVISNVKFLIDVFAFVIHIFISVIQLFLNIITTLLESVPVIE